MPRKKNQEEFIADAHKVHRNKYDYSKVVYRNNKEPVTIICREHGEFQMLPMYHLNGGICPKCNGRNLTTPGNSYIEDSGDPEVVYFSIATSKN